VTFERFRDHHPALSDVFAYAPLNQISLVIDRRSRKPCPWDNWCPATTTVRSASRRCSVEQ